MSHRILRAAAGALVVVLLAAGCGGKGAGDQARASGADGAACEASPGRITIATAGAGSVFYAIGSGFALLISDNTKLKATAAETGGSGQNIQQLVAGDYDIAIAQHDIAVDAVAGKGLFEGKPQRVRALARLYPSYTHLVVRADAGIESIADLRGKRVSTSSPRSGTEIIAQHLLRIAGLDPEKDIQVQRLDFAKTIDGFKGGTIDAFFWSSGLPVAQVTDLTNSMKDNVKIIDLSSYIDDMEGINQAYERSFIPAAVYKRTGDIPTVAVYTILLVREDFPSGDACAITRLLFDKKTELEKVHSVAKDITLSKATQTDPVPLHSGARQALNALGAG
jgi:uncharacterized protein